MFFNNGGFNNQGASLAGWNTGAATTMASMFEGAATFNRDISAWNVSNVTSFASMFRGAANYTNAGVSLQTWNPLAATNMSYMFAGCKYNQPLCGNWAGNTLQGVTTMAAMFGQAFGNNANTVFNQDISCWDVSTVQDFGSMFTGAVAFNNGGAPLIPGWNTAAATNMTSMFQSAFAFRQPLAGINITNVTSLSAFLNGANYPQSLYDAC